jgi:hypothetical protein
MTLEIACAAQASIPCSLGDLPCTASSPVSLAALSLFAARAGRLCVQVLPVYRLAAAAALEAVQQQALHAAVQQQQAAAPTSGPTNPPFLL